MIIQYCRLSFSQSSLLKARIIRPSTCTPIRHLRTNAVVFNQAAQTGTEKPKQKQQQQKKGGGKKDDKKLASQAEDFNK